ncbi:Tyrocidine synthase 3 [Actinosynnema sp. ALI-1.44]
MTVDPTIELRLTLNGDPDVPALTRAWAALRARHPALAGPLGAHRDVAAFEDAVRAGPGCHLLRAPGRHEFALTAGCDAASVPAVLAELSALYARELGHPSAGLPAPAPVVPHDRPPHDAEPLPGPELPGPELPGPELPGLELFGRGEPGPRVVTRVDLGHQTRRHVSALARRHGVTREVVVVTAWALLLGELAEREEFLLGLVTDPRDPAAHRPAVGALREARPLRVDLTGRPSFADAVRRTTAAVATARSRRGGAPAEVAVQYGEQPAAALRLAGLDPAEVPAGFWLADDLPGPHRVVLRLLDTPDGLLAGVAHHPDALDGPGARRWVSRLAALLAGAHDESPEPVVMSEDEHRRVVLAPNATAVDLGAPATVHDLVAEQARRTPDRTALVFAGAEVGYAELDARANRLAHELRERGVRRETPVAVCLERETGLVVALLAVLKAGGAFVPLDPQYPRHRLAHMLADSGAAVVLTQGRLRDRFAGDGPPVLVTDDDATRFAHHPSSAPPASSGPDDLAYVVYTSGSTGRPKGVMVEHRGIASYLRGMQHDFPLTPEDRVLQATSLSFDVSVYEIFWPLAVGAAVVLPAPGGHTDPYHLSELIQRHGVTCLHFVPSLMRLFVEEADPGAGAGLRRVFVSGEALDPSLVALVHERTSAELVNLYGATEVSVDSTYWTADRARPDRPVLVGRPMANATAYVLDQRLRPKPAGVVGEVFLGGASVTRGYHARPALTAERFVPDPFGPPGSRLYRTGDLGRVTPDGELEFLGRRDHQFKLRGWRVEAGEIEAAITAHPGVNGAVVVTEGAHEQATLLAYVGADAGLDQAALREFLAQRLPRPLVPARFIRLDRLPISPNGKVDRAALPKPDQVPAEPAPTTAAPPAHATDGRPALERGSGDRPALEVVLEVAAEVLGAPIGPEDSFFGSGGNSIQATRLAARLRAALHTEVPVRLAFEAPTPAAMAALLSPPSAEPVAEVSRAEQRIWLLSRLGGHPAEYAIPVALRLAGPLDVAKLKSAVDAVVRRHEGLRHVFPEVDGAPTRVVLEPGSITVAEEAHRSVREVLAEGVAALDPATGPLARFTLVNQGPRDHVLAIVLHHLIADGWSVDVLLRDIAAHYTGAPTATPGRYADYLALERAEEQDGALGRALEHFVTALDGVPDEVSFPPDHPRPAQRTGRGDVVRHRIDAAPVTALAERLRTTPFAVLLAAVGVLLHRVGGHRDVVVGTAVARRPDAELDHLVGLCLNTLALRWPVQPHHTLGEVVRAVTDRLADGLQHDAASFDRVVDKLAPARDSGRTPVFQVMALYEEPYETALELPGVTTTDVTVHCGSAQADASFGFVPRDGGIDLTLQFSTDVFTRATATRWTRRLATLLAGARADTRVADLPLLPEDERQDLERWSGATREAPTTTLHGLAHEIAQRHPGRPAIHFGRTTITYGEFDARTARLAHELRARGVQAETPVVVCLERSPEALIAVYGVLKAGGAYVPVEAGNPDRRIAELIADSGAALVLTQRRLADRVAALGAEVVVVDEPLPRHPTTDPEPLTGPDHLAYVIYTSGSTGRPKGVMVQHGSVLNFLDALDRRFDLTPDDRLLHKSPLAFDVSVREVFWALTRGASVVVAEPGRHADPGYLVDLVERERVTVAHFVPSSLAVFLEGLPGPGRCPTLRHVLTSGETLPAATARAARELLGARLRNMYGPTETTVEMTDHDVVDDTVDRLPIGRPFEGAVVRVLDADLRPVPPGSTGELCVGGLPVARGYLGRPALTAERFVPDPLGPAGARLYRTGDLARLLPDGQLDFLGRNDFQVKVRGHRIEPGEVEAVLGALPGVHGALVVAHDDRLIGYAVTDRPGEELRTALAERLPEHLVPSAVLALDRFPLTGNGKLDRAALPTPTGRHTGESRPLTATEAALAAIWRDLLDVPEVRADDHFFALGGHSLLAARVAARAATALGVALPLPTVLRFPRLADLATAVDGTRADREPVRPRPDRRHRAPLSSAQRRLWIEENLRPGTAAYTVPEAFRLRGELDEKAFAAAVDDVLRRHDALRAHVESVEDGEPELVVAPGPRTALRVGDLPADRVRDALAAESARVFDPAGPLVATSLHRLAPDEWLFQFTAHHLVVDGWSLDVLWRDLAACYHDRRAGRAPRPREGLTFTDYTWWERDVRARDLDPHLAFWRGELAGLRPQPPADAHGPGAVLDFALGAALSDELRATAAGLGVSPFVLGLTAFALALGEDSPGAIGVEVANRASAQTADLVGLFVNHVPVRVAPRGTGRAAVAAVDEARRRVLPHEHVPFDLVVDLLGPGRAPTSVAFSHLDVRGHAPRLDGVTATRLTPPHNGTAKFDLLLEVLDTEHGLTGAFEYRPERFTAARVAQVRNHWEAALLTLLADPDLPVDARRPDFA